MREEMPSELEWVSLKRSAWKVRDHAAVERTKVGCALQVEGTSIVVVGCNVEHMWRTCSVHAEVNALTNMIAQCGPKARASKILITAERHKFTPCGGCMDMIMQYGGPTCKVGYQNDIDGMIKWAFADELMPEYPC